MYDSSPERAYEQRTRRARASVGRGARSSKPTVKKDNRRESVEVRRDNEIVYPHQKEEEDEEEEDKVNAFVRALDRHPLTIPFPSTSHAHPSSSK